jgi:hypothetical protein
LNVAEDDLDAPPELTPGFMPSFRRAISRFMKPAKRRRKDRRRKRGLRALLSRFMVQSKFMQPPSASKPPAAKQDSSKTAPLTPRFRNKSGPKL